MLDLYDIDFRIVCEQRCNALLEGAVSDTDAALRALRSRLKEPVGCYQPPLPLSLPVDDAGLFILRDAASLTRDDQRRLLNWTSDGGAGMQIISTASRPLFTLVSAGLFDAALYYRLNVVLLRVGTLNRPGASGEDGDRASARASSFA